MINKTKFQLKKDGEPNCICFCTKPELIENYDKAIADKERTWICHHKKEEFYTMQELKDLGMYYNVPPEDLVFVKDHKEHYSWPHKGYEKVSEANKGNSYRAKIKVQCVETGQIFESIKAARKFVELKGSDPVCQALKNPNATAAGYHWKKV